MDLLTYGFLSIVIIIMVTKWLFEWKMYKNSVYGILYSTFTEYRMRKKTVIGMSESMKLNELFGSSRIIYHVLDSKQNKLTSFVTIFLSSGCYVIGISMKNMVDKNSVKIVEKFLHENIMDKLDKTIYMEQEIPTHIILLVSDNELYGNNQEQIGSTHIIKRSEVIENIKEIHNASKSVLTQEDISHIFQLVAQEALKTEKELADSKKMW